MSFIENGYEVVRNVLNPQSLNLLCTEFEILKEVVYHNKQKSPNDFLGDVQTDRSFSYYSPYCFESLLLVLKDEVEKIVDKKLGPAYSYARIYYQGATLEKHTDRSSCQYSTSVCIKNDKTPWPIWFLNRDGKNVSISLNAGDMVVYRGDELIHWREEYKETKQIQAFLHYVDLDGDFESHILDKRKVLGLPKAKYA
jgi:hypothetical protein